MSLADIFSRAQAEFQTIVSDGRAVEQKLAAALHLGAMHSQLQALQEKKANMVQRIELDFADAEAKLRDEFKSLTQ